MNRFDDDRRSMHEPREASARFARLLDRAVAVARAGKLCDVAGRVAVALVLALLAIVVGMALGVRIPFPVGPVVVMVAVGIAVWQGLRRWTWPDRLSTAMALEGADPRIGERISRAVALNPPTRFEAEPSEDLPTVDLIREAVEEAAKQLESVAADRSVFGGFARSPLFPLRWPLAGLACAAGALIAAIAAPKRLQPLLAEAFLVPHSTERAVEVVQAEPTSIVPKAAAAAAIRLAEAAATEERLAAALLARFAVSPGAIRESLPRGEQDWLDEIASLQATIADDIGRDLSTVVLAVAETDRRLAAELAGGLVRERTAMLASAAERIGGNQLAVASGLITSQVRPIVAALRSLGVTAREKTGPAFDRGELVQRRIVSAIEADAARAAGGVDAAGATAKGDATELVPADAAGREPSSIATSEIDRGGSGVGGATGEAGGPSAAGGSTSTAIVAKADGLLPAWVRAREERRGEALLGDDFAAPPRYRAAVNDYYRRLWAAESPTEREASP